MVDWIEEHERQKAEGLRKQEERREAERVAGNARQFGANALFARLIEAVQSDIELHNAKKTDFQHKLLPLEVGVNGFQVERKYDPSYFLKAVFRPEIPVIEYVIMRPVYPGLKRSTESGQIQFSLQNNGAVVALKNEKPTTVEEISKDFIRIAWDGYALPLE